MLPSLYFHTLARMLPYQINDYYFITERINVHGSQRFPRIAAV